MNVADAVTRHAAARPDAVAVVDGGLTLDYRAFDAAIWRAAAALRALGIAPGALVGVTLSSNALHLVAGYALARMGAIQLSLPLREPTALRQALAGRFGVSVVLGDGDESKLPGLSWLCADHAWLEPAGRARDPALRAPGGEAPWKIVMTSGTTAAPKAVLQTHAMHLAWRELNQQAVPVRPEDRYLSIVELDFFAGFRLCMDVHWAGGAVILGAGRESPEAFIEAAERHRASYAYLTPTHLHRLLPVLPPGRTRLPRLKRVRTGSMIVPETLRREILSRLTAGLVVAYGTNDVGSPFTIVDGEALQRFPDSVGFPVRGVTVQVVDEEGCPRPAGELGVIRVRTPGMPPEYIGNPEASAKAFREGWYYPGDLGVLSREGALYFKGRADDLMNFDGVKVFPSEIESVLLEHPAVAEAVAFPVPSERHQDVPAAAVVLRAPASAADLHGFCLARLGSRCPGHIAIVSALPRNAAGKILRRELAALVKQGVRRDG